MMVPEYIAIILSVTFVLIFGEVVPQSIISRFGLQFGGNLYWLVWILMVASSPISWPMGKRTIFSFH
jgi:metal transporter CNNM